MNKLLKKSSLKFKSMLGAFVVMMGLQFAPNLCFAQAASTTPVPIGSFFGGFVTYTGVGDSRVAFDAANGNYYPMYWNNRTNNPKGPLWEVNAAYNVLLVTGAMDANKTLTVHAYIKGIQQFFNNTSFPTGPRRLVIEDLEIVEPNATLFTTPATADNPAQSYYEIGRGSGSVGIKVYDWTTHELLYTAPLSPLVLGGIVIDHR